MSLPWQLPARRTRQSQIAAETRPLRRQERATEFAAMRTQAEQQLPTVVN